MGMLKQQTHSCRQAVLYNRGIKKMIKRNYILFLFFVLIWSFIFPLKAEDKEILSIPENLNAGKSQACKLSEMIGKNPEFTIKFDLKIIKDKLPEKKFYFLHYAGRLSFFIYKGRTLVFKLFTQKPWDKDDSNNVLLACDLPRPGEYAEIAIVWDGEYVKLFKNGKMTNAKEMKSFTPQNISQIVVGCKDEIMEISNFVISNYAMDDTALKKLIENKK
jgi:hypothetical protein